MFGSLRCSSHSSSLVRFRSKRLSFLAGSQNSSLSCPLLPARPLHRAVHPMRRHHLFIKVQLYHCPNTFSPLRSLPQQRAIGGNVALGTFCCHAPVLVLLRLPLFHTEMAPVPMAFTEWMRYDASLPFQLFFEVPAFCSHFLKAPSRLTSYHSGPSSL